MKRHFNNVISKEDLENLYLSGLSSRQIGDKYGFSQSAVQRSMRKYNIAFRDSAAQQTSLNETKKIKFSYEQEQLVLGSLLGDTFIYKNSFKSNKTDRIVHSYRLLFAHAEKHEEYLKHKHNILKGCKIKSRISGHGSVMKHYAFSHTPTVKPYYDLCFKDGKLNVNKEWLDRVDLLGLAYFYQDDGSLALNKGKLSRLNFHTNSFKENELILTQNKLSSIGLDTKITPSPDTRVGLCADQYILTCYKNDMVKDFLRNIYPYHVPCMAYKFRLITGESV
jgi:hypothetical protein